MKFDFAIGNPPYQQTSENTSDKPVYNLFMDATYKAAEKVELITPARFLFNAGKTPREWNEKMLNDEHFKVLSYKQTSKEVFPGTDIKGGVAITYRDGENNFGPIKVFTHIEELRSIKDKVISKSKTFLDRLVYAPESYRFSSLMHVDHPEIKYVDSKHGILSKGHDFDLTTNIFDKLSEIIFFDKEPNDGLEYIRIIGRKNNARKFMFIRKNYVDNHENLEKWKIILPKSNGSGALGEVLSTPLIGEPLIGHTQSFISIGAFDSKFEANALLKYLKTKFARTMLGVLKITQDNKKGVWAFVPLQDFTSNSDINWNVSVKEIDKQLYKKYGLSPEEVEFIEKNVKEMS